MQKHAFLFFVLLSASAPSLAEENCGSLLVESMEGPSLLLRASGEKAELEAQDEVVKGETVSTGTGAWVDLRLCDGSGLRVGESSRITFEEALAKNEAGWVSWAFDLFTGSLLATVQGEEKSQDIKMRVRTPTASVGVRGTEFHVEAEEAGDTTVHTMEGEVLMGKREDFDSLSKRDFSKFQERFEAVRKERMSRIARGEGRPRKASEFKPSEFRQRRPGFFRNPMRRLKQEELKQRWQQAAARWQEKKAKWQQMSPDKKEQVRQGVQEKFQEKKEERRQKFQEMKQQFQERKQERGEGAGQQLREQFRERMQENRGDNKRPFQQQWKDQKQQWQQRKQEQKGQGGQQQPWKQWKKGQQR